MDCSVPACCDLLLATLKMALGFWLEIMPRYCHSDGPPVKLGHDK